jgi:Zinc finger, C2H2 type
MDVHNKVRFSCDKCGSEFSVKTTLKHHMQKCLNGIISYRSPRFRNERTDNDKTKVRYKCFIEACDREFSSRKYLGFHLEREHSLKMENFETTCLDCQMVFENVGDYAKHVKIHSCNFICEICKTRFKTKEKLQAHTEKLHKEGDDRPFVCAEDECGARFKRAEHLRGHQLYKHSDEKKFSCTECNLKFRQRGEFNVHMRVHQNVKPFSCWKCDHLCKTSSNLRQHMKIVHNEDHIYYCNICQATFEYNTDLTQHRKEHASTNATVYEIVEISSIV